MFDKKRVRVISIAVIALIVLFAAAIALYFLSPINSFKYKMESNGVLFLSNEKAPQEHLKELAGQKTFLIAPALYEQDNLNYYMSNSLNLFLVSLIGNDKNAVSVARVFDKRNRLLYCQSNFGQVKENRTLSVEECNSMLFDSANVKIFIEFPSSSFEKNMAILENNSVKIFATTPNNVLGVSLEAVKAMYPNVNEILKKTNEFAELVKG